MEVKRFEIRRNDGEAEVTVHEDNFGPFTTTFSQDDDGSWEADGVVSERSQLSQFDFSGDTAKPPERIVVLADAVRECARVFQKEMDEEPSIPPRLWP